MSTTYSALTSTWSDFWRSLVSFSATNFSLWYWANTVYCIFIVGSCLRVDPIPHSFNWFSSPPSPSPHPSHIPESKVFCKVGMAVPVSNSILYAIVLPFLLWLCKFIVEWSIVPNFSKFLSLTRNITNFLLKIDLNIYKKTTFAPKMWSKTHIVTNLRPFCEIDQKVLIFVEKLKEMQPL